MSSVIFKRFYIDCDMCSISMEALIRLGEREQYKQILDKDSIYTKCIRHLNILNEFAVAIDTL